VALIVFSLDDPQSLGEIEFWHQMIQDRAPDCEWVLVGTHSDVVERALRIEDGKVRAFDLNIPSYVETSARTGEGIEELKSKILAVPKVKEAIARSDKRVEGGRSCY
jgi:GTPase SAR1 family protein